MSDQIIKSDLLVDLSTEEQQLTSGGSGFGYGRPFGFFGGGRGFRGYGFGRPFGFFGRGRGFRGFY
jgi:hypothetical protein